MRQTSKDDDNSKQGKMQSVVYYRFNVRKGFIVFFIIIDLLCFFFQIYAQLWHIHFYV